MAGGVSDAAAAVRGVLSALDKDEGPGLRHALMCNRGRGVAGRNGSYLKHRQRVRSATHSGILHPGERQQACSSVALQLRVPRLAGTPRRRNADQTMTASGALGQNETLCAAA